MYCGLPIQYKIVYVDIRVSRVNEKCSEKCRYYFVLANLGLKNTIITYYCFKLRAGTAALQALLKNGKENSIA
jgi:hypothetical protein